MATADFIEANKEIILHNWRAVVVARLAIDLELSELVNDLPVFLDDLIVALRSADGAWPSLAGAERHGSHRLRIGMDIGGLMEEMTLVGETIVALARDLERPIAPDDAVALYRVIGHGAAISARAYVALRDRELATQLAEHYSFIAHEIRTPLHTAQLTANMLATNPQDAARLAGRLGRALQQVSELVDNSILGARLQGRVRLRPGRVSTKELADDVISDSEDFARARNVTIELDVDDVELVADRKLLYSAVSNLVRNGIKFSCPGGAVALRIHANADRMLFEVTDACGGIPEDALKRLFLPFVQENRDRSGFGLGLLIVKEVVEAHGGSVRVANRPDEGCTFIIDLPYVHVETAAD